jgi:predicted phage terminase large subunit-like protein
MTSNLFEIPQFGEDIDLEGTLLSIDKADCEESLCDFVQGGWKYIDPNPYVHGWHIEAIAEHLQAVADGDIRRLVINVPPRTSKSSIVSVAFPAWTWTQPIKSHTSGAGVQFLFASYAQSLSIRDSTKCRRLVDSPWYKSRWGDRVQLTSDQATKIRFDNISGGYRLATSVGGALTGEGGSIIVVDDPHNAVEMDSDLVRQNTLDWWDNSLSTRLNDPKKGAYIVIMQRLHEDDLTGHIMSKNSRNWTHLCLPMKYEWSRHSYTKIGWDDPRGLDEDGNALVIVDESSGDRIAVSSEAQKILDEEREGVLLCPERFGSEEIFNLESSLGPYQSAGQLQQRPEPKGGGIFKRDWWQLWEPEKFPAFDYVIASIDTAYTTREENDPSAMTVWGVFSHRINRTNRVVFHDKFYDINEDLLSQETSQRVMLMHAWQGRYELHELIEKVAETCRKMKVDRLLIESKASGISVAQEIRRMYVGTDFAVQLIDPKSQDKVARAYSVQHLFSEKMIYAPDRSWADMVITQCGQFPKGKHDDIVDTVTQALRYLRMTNIVQRGEEVTRDLKDKMSDYKGGELLPLYPV